MSVTPSVATLKTWTNIGEVLYGNDLNGNFSAIVTAFETHTHTEYTADNAAETITASWTINAAMKFADGSAAAPIITFAADVATGLYRIGSNNIGIALNGVKAMDLKVTGLELINPAGNAATKWTNTLTSKTWSAGHTGGSDFGIAEVGVDTWFKIVAGTGATTVKGAFACNNATPQTKATLGAAATDLASVITLANNLRTMAINNGMGQL